jgi:hypothetical protein
VRSVELCAASPQDYTRVSGQFTPIKRSWLQLTASWAYYSRKPAPERPDGILTMSEMHVLSFTVLLDQHNQITAGLAVVTHRSDAVCSTHALPRTFPPPPF